MSLPNELLDSIVETAVLDDSTTLKRLSLVSPFFLHRCRYHLFHTIHFSADKPNPTFQKMLNANSSLFSYPRTLRITSCFDLLPQDQFTISIGGGFLRMVEHFDNLRNLVITDVKHPDSVPHWSELPAALQAAYQSLLARPLTHLTICLPKGFPGHLITSNSTLQELSLDDTTDSLDDLGAETVPSGCLPSWSLVFLHHCHRGVFCMPLLQSMSPPYPMFSKLTCLALDIVKLEGHVFAWSKMLPAFRGQLSSLTLRYTGPTTSYPGSGTRDLLRAALKDVNTHARIFPSFVNLRYLHVELRSLQDRSAASATAVPDFQPLFLHSMLGGRPQPGLLAFSADLHWVTSLRTYLSLRHTTLPAERYIIPGQGWMQLDGTLSSQDLFPNLIAVRMGTTVIDRGRLFTSHSFRNSVSAALTEQMRHTLERTKGRVRVFDAGNEATEVDFDNIANAIRK
ncbi:hypothetical protein NMY22_g9697 [Coprinellus aureogranulatus]|nr:hypothetical protein NMY22_g9697 [Coprinellus aureogranulatus]